MKFSIHRRFFLLLMIMLIYICVSFRITNADSIFSYPLSGYTKVSLGGFIPNRSIDISTSGHFATDCVSSSGNWNVTPIYQGSVVDSHDYVNGAAGKYVIVQHEINGVTFYSEYQHLASVAVSNGQSVNTNTVIGIAGDTGVAEGVHLHYEIFTGRCDPWAPNQTQYAVNQEVDGPVTVEGTTYYNPDRVISGLSVIEGIGRYGTLDLNGVLDGVNNGWIHGFGTANVYINGNLVAENEGDYYNSTLPEGTSYRIDNIQSYNGFSYAGLADGSASLSGTITANTTTDVRLKFNTNTLTGRSLNDATAWAEQGITGDDNIKGTKNGYDYTSNDTTLSYLVFDAYGMRRITQPNDFVATGVITIINNEDAGTSNMVDSWNKAPRGAILVWKRSINGQDVSFIGIARGDGTMVTAMTDYGVTDARIWFFNNNQTTNQGFVYQGWGFFSGYESANGTLVVPVQISRTVTFKVANGAWDDGTTVDKTVTLSGYEGEELKLTTDQIPVVGAKPAANYKAGSWDIAPSTETAISADTIYTYTYEAKTIVSHTVTFKVINGLWNDGTTADKTVTLTGYEGDMLKLAAYQIPAVGSYPYTNYTSGEWGIVPSTETAITADTTYTYTYALKNAISSTVTFKVVNGTWNDGTNADKTVTLSGYEGDTLKLTEDQIPAVGTNPAANYKSGGWDTTPNPKNPILGNTTYTYTYAPKNAISRTVTFKVVNGSWDDETTADKTVTLNGYEGDTLKLTADQIPAVGSKPNETYKEGSWDTEPDTATAITSNKTYTYTYAEDENDNRVKLIVSSERARPGEEVTIGVSIENNPGIRVINFVVDYDISKLSYLGYEDSGLEGWLREGNGTGLLWQGNNDTDFNGEILKLKFSVLEEVDDGDVIVTLTDSDITNGMENDFTCVIQGGKITVYSFLPGDLNGDGKVTVKDLVRLQRYILDRSVEIFGNPDTNGDGKITVKDLVRLQRYILDRSIVIY